MQKYGASVIISIYNNIDALRIILYALKLQSISDFEIIVSEDGCDAAVKQYITNIEPEYPNLIHLTQEDLGFRKNRALNRAIIAANSDYLVFIDGDCVPHPCFIESHSGNAEAGYICSGRRSEPGPRLSGLLLRHPSFYKAITNPLSYCCMTVPALIDDAKNYEAGLYSGVLHNITKAKQPGIVGCNFSCHREDLLRVNGFNEDYVHPAIGEDADIEWRMRQVGARVKNIKFLAPFTIFIMNINFRLRMLTGRSLKTP